MSNSTHTVKIEKLVYGGDAMGRLDDERAVFVPFALPEETVEIELTEDKKRFARGNIVKIITPSPQRITPRCGHFGECGGCHYQQLIYVDQLNLKEEILLDQLTRLGGFENPPIKPIIASPEEWYYRNHIQFHQAQSGEMGFMAAGSHHLVPITECYLPNDAINQLWPQLQLDNLEDLQRIGLRQGMHEELMLVLESEVAEAYEIEIEADITAVQLTPEGSHVLANDFHIIHEVKGRPFQVSAPSFFQVNTPMAEKMVNHLLAHLPLMPTSTVLDVYCGVGLFSAFIAPQVKAVIGIEISPSAVEDFGVNLDEFDNVSIYEDTAENALPHLEATPEIVLVDPPRSGLDPTALDAIVALQPTMIAYISCDPATLARDGKRLTEQGYTLQEITPFDLFPQTYHIESISFWTL